MQKLEIKPEIVERFALWQRDPEVFIFDMWGLIPQPLLSEYSHVAETLPAKDFKPNMFVPFVRGVHLTWQQWLVIRAVRNAVNGRGKKRIAIESGHGTGKSEIISKIILWYLVCYPLSQIPITAPTNKSLKDILWKNISSNHSKMPEMIKNLIEVIDGYVKIKEKPKEWFARGKTASVDKPEALAGIHGEYVFYVIDEASGVHDKIFEVAEGALTDENILMIMASQHTRLEGYFHEAFNKDHEYWECLTFNSEESPIVNWTFVQRIIDKFGKDSDTYRVRVQGKSPKEGFLDDKGYTSLILPGDIRWAQDAQLAGRRKLGVDPAGEGDDQTLWVLRDPFKAMIVGREKISSDKSIAQKTLMLMSMFNVEDRDVTIDNFGVGANVGIELARAGKNVKCINVGEPYKTKPGDLQKFLNLRAYAFWMVKQWMISGGELVRDPGFEELLSIKFTRTLNDSIQIMGKLMMRKQGIKSPNVADALMLTFVDDFMTEMEQEAEDINEDDDTYTPAFNDIGI